MLQSMTGFGKAVVEAGNISYQILLKSVNSKNADVSVKLPHSFRDRENELRAYLVSALGRGKIDLYVSYELMTTKEGGLINEKMLLSYFSDLERISKGLDIKKDTLFSIAARMPNILSQEKNEGDDANWQTFFKGISEATSQLSEWRKKEGGILAADMNGRVKKILNGLRNIEQWEKERITLVKERLHKNLSQVGKAEGFNKDRFEQELIYYMEKMDFTEEKTRLLAHCNLFNETIGQTESQGRKLSFIVQEMGREINTIGSKANHAEIQQVIVDMKDELEKIKEQLFNIL